MRRRTPNDVPTLPYAGTAVPVELDLTLCEHCSSDLVEPITWESAGPELWRVGLRCPNCERCREGVFSQACVDLFDERLDDAASVMIADLRRLEAAIMEDEIARFVGALQVGAILPEDFAR